MFLLSDQYNLRYRDFKHSTLNERINDKPNRGNIDIKVTNGKQDRTKEQIYQLHTIAISITFKDLFLCRGDSCTIIHWH